MKYNCLILFWMSFLSHFALQGQTILGRVSDLNNGEVLPFVHIVWKSDSVVLDSKTSEIDGTFKMVNGKRLAANSYLLLQYFGYSTDTVLIANISLSDTFAIGDLKLSYLTTTLETVEVIGRKPLYKIEHGKVIFNVGQSDLAKGNSSMEIISKAPGISVDALGNISLKGRSGVNIMVNGKTLLLSGDNLKNYLSGLPSEMLDKIEIISNPKANFDASGTAGVVNLVLKKNEILGFNSNVNAGASFGKYFRGNGNVNVNYRVNEKLSFYSSIGMYKGQLKTINNSNRILEESQNKMAFIQNGSSNTKINNQNFQFGTEYESKRNTLGILISGMNSGNNTITESVTEVISRQRDSIINFNGLVKTNLKNISLTLNDKWMIDTMGGYIEFNVSYYPSVYDSKTDQNASFYNGVGSKFKPSEFEKFNTPSDIEIQAYSVDFLKSYKFGDLDCGVKSSIARSNNELLFYYLIDSNWTNDKRRSNRFNFDEKIYAAYGGLTWLYKGFEIYNGIRVEKSTSIGNSVTIDSVFERNLFNVFPNVYIAKNFGQSSFSFSYARRIDRPIYSQLNPFEYYIDRFSYWRGNVNLKPQLTNSFELGYSYNWLNAALNFSKTTGFYTQIPEQNSNGKIFNTYQNIGNSRYLGLTITANNYIGKKWASYNNFGLYHTSTIDTRNDSNPNNEVNGLQYYFNSQNTFSFHNGYSTEVSLNYFSTNTSFWVMKNYYNVNVSFKKRFKNNSTLTIQFFDIFNSTNYTSKIDYGELNVDSYYKPETRYVGLFYNIPIGNAKVKKAKKVNANLNEEKSRVKYN